MFPKVDYLLPSEICFSAIVSQLSKLHPSHSSSQTPSSIHDSPCPSLPTTKSSASAVFYVCHSHAGSTTVPKFLQASCLLVPL